MTLSEKDVDALNGRYTSTACRWILDSGGAGRGAWQGGVLYELMRWARLHGGYPRVMMGASAGGYAAADVATGTEATVLKGWSAWGSDDIPARYPLPTFVAKEWPRSRFRRHLHASIRYVMGDAELDGVFDDSDQRTLLVFTSRVRRCDGQAPGRADLAKLFAMAATRKLPRPLKYLPRYHVDPVVFATSPTHCTPSSCARSHDTTITARSKHRAWCHWRWGRRWLRHCSLATAWIPPMPEPSSSTEDSP